MSEIVEVIARVLSERAKGEPNESYADTARAALSALEAEGWVVVPKVATGQMLRAGHVSLCALFEEEAESYGCTMDVWRDMLSACPPSLIVGGT